MTVWLHTDAARQYPYCAIRTAHPGGRITAWCAWSCSYAAVCVATDPGELACPRCLTALEDRTTDPYAKIEIDASRTTTMDMRPLRPAVHAEWEVDLGALEDEP